MSEHAERALVQLVIGLVVLLIVALSAATGAVLVMKYGIVGALAALGAVVLLCGLAWGVGRGIAP